jgi:hypothetical protein
MNAESSSLDQDQGLSKNGSDAVGFDYPGALFQSEEQALLMTWLSGLFQNGQMSADISPNTNILNYFQNIAAQGTANLDHGAHMGMPGRFFGLQQWLSALSARTDLLNMQGADPTVLGLNADGSGFEGQKTVGDADTLDAVRNFLLKMAAHHQAGEHHLSENSKMAVAGKGSRLSHGTAGNSGLETVLDPQLSGKRKNMHLPKFQAAAKTGENLATPQVTAETMVTKPSEDVSGMKSPNLKTQMALSDALGHKVIQVEADHKDSSLLNAQDQMSERMLKFENTVRAPQSGQRSLSNQAMHQIVQKAVLSFHNGQNQVQIHLKPEFLGHIRMQIVTENQQVAIKILAELPFVKDMLESNLNQLKADLQAQGLKIDELDVSVAHDSNSGDRNQAAADASKRRAINSNPEADDELSEELDPSQSDGLERITESAIDYFA